MRHSLFKLTLKWKNNFKCLYQTKAIVEVFQLTASVVATRYWLHETCVEFSEKLLQCLSCKHQQLILLPLWYGSFINTLL